MLGILLLVPLAPTLLVLAAGWLFPGRMPWIVADYSVPVGPLLTSALAACMLQRARAWPAWLRIVAFVPIIAVMAVASRMELVFATPCVTQRGEYINFQRQERERREAQDFGCS